MENKFLKEEKQLENKMACSKCKVLKEDLDYEYFDSVMRRSDEFESQLDAEKKRQECAKNVNGNGFDLALSGSKTFLEEQGYTLKKTIKNK